MAKDRLVVVPKEMVIPDRTIVREGDRFKIYLPKSMNKLWTVLRSRKVDVYIVVIGEGGEK